MKHIKLFPVIFITLLVLWLGISLVHPLTISSVELPEQISRDIQTQAGGFHSASLPLIPLFVTINNYSENRVDYTIYYFPFGTVGMSFLKGEGYTVEKPLSGR